MLYASLSLICAEALNLATFAYFASSGSIVASSVSAASRKKGVFLRYSSFSATGVPPKHDIANDEVVAAQNCKLLA